MTEHYVGDESKRKTISPVNNNDKIFFVTDYSEELTSVCKIVQKYLPVLYNDRQLQEVT